MTVPLSRHVAHVQRPSPAAPAKGDRPRRGPDRPRLAAFTVHLDHDFGERVRNAAHATGESVAHLLTVAIANHVLDLERRHHDGQLFPPRPSLSQRMANGTHQPAPDASEGRKAGD